LMLSFKTLIYVFNLIASITLLKVIYFKFLSLMILKYSKTTRGLRSLIENIFEKYFLYSFHLRSLVNDVLKLGCNISILFIKV
jgi:hypothetical protein